MIALLSTVAFLGVGWVDSAEAKCRCNKKMEAKLEKEFSYYSDPGSVMDFNFDVAKQANHVEVYLLGQNFNSQTSDWTQRDPGLFKDYLGDLGWTVSHEMERPMVRMHVVGDQGEEITVYRFE